MIRIPYSDWLSWSNQERAEMLAFLEGKRWYFDLDQKPPKNSRISDFEEYTGDSGDRGVDGRGFGPPGKMQLSRKS